MFRRRAGRLITRPLSAALALWLAACASQPLAITHEPASLRLVASDSCAPLAKDLIAAYEEAHPWVSISLVGVYGSALAEQTLRAGGADIALLSWLEGSGTGAPLWSQPFARDGIAIIAHPSIPFTETGFIHLQEVFRGRVQEWGGTVLTVVSREAGSGTRAAFESRVLGGHETTLTAVVMPSSEAVGAYVASTPGAIGYVSTLQMGTGVIVLPVEGSEPTEETIADGSYPLARPLHLATVGEPAGEAREFAQWVLGPEGQQIVGR